MLFPVSRRPTTAPDAPPSAPGRPRTARPHTARRTLAATTAVAAAVTVLAGCGSASRPAAAGTAGGAVGAGGTPATRLRLGYLPNLTQASVLVGLDQGAFAHALGAGTTLTADSFDAGPAAVTALFAGSLDAAFVGPNPALNAYRRSRGAFVVVAGATAGGAEFVVAPGISTAADLKGKTVADPQLGNTQDVALRTWLAGQGLAAPVTGSGDVTVTPQDNATTLSQFQAGTLAGAWVPEPWASRMVLTGHGHVLVDEASLWPGGRFATTVLVVAKSYLAAHGPTVQALLRGEDAVISALHASAHPATVVDTALAHLAGKGLSAAVAARAYAHITVTDDPIAASLATDAQHAATLGLSTSAGIGGLLDLTALNAVHAAAGLPPVTAS